MKVARKKSALPTRPGLQQTYIHRNLAGQKGVAGYIQCAESEKHAAKNFLSNKAVIQNRRRD